MTNLELSAPVFSILSSFLEEKVGITYTARDRELLEDKASSRAQDLGYESLLDYYYFLRYDSAGERELTELVETLVVNETYFFREWSAIQTLVNSFIVPWCESGKKPRIWSAACATGEEPLSLAMALDEKNLLDKVEIVATDISSRALARAQSGTYGKRSVRTVPDPMLFEKNLSAKNGAFEIRRHLLSAIDWKRLNLMDCAQVKALGCFDAILCRNVLIYFSDQVVRNVLDTLSGSLSKDGILLVGVSESLLRYSGHFIGEERAGAFVYRKTQPL